jgi:hypothetical protein
LTLLSGDRLELYPIALKRRPAAVQPATSRRPEFTTGHRLLPDSVCLYSGGADSFSGAAFLLRRRRRPILVSHSVGPVSGLQQRLFASLRSVFPQLPASRLLQTGAHPNQKRARLNAHGSPHYWRPRDFLQRLRSIFFFSLAAMAARAAGIDELFMCENGIVGAAIVFAPIDDTPFTTRPTEPHYLRAVEEFLWLALVRPGLRIRNPFQYLTKGEVLLGAAELGLRDDLHRTVSCWRSGNRGVRNCGQCVPCLFRQLAFDEAGLPPAPEPYAYQHPIPFPDWRTWDSREVERLADIRAYCAQALDGGVPWLMQHELAVADAVDVTGGAVTKKSPGSSDRRDTLAPIRMARTILRFANATVARLP